jgi:hypothetical protein
MHAGGNAAVNACWRQCRCANACWRQCRGEFMLVLTLAAMPLRMCAGGNAAVSACRLQLHMFFKVCAVLCPCLCSRRSTWGHHASCCTQLRALLPHSNALKHIMFHKAVKLQRYAVQMKFDGQYEFCYHGSIVFEIKPDDPEP